MQTTPVSSRLAPDSFEVKTQKLAPGMAGAGLLLDAAVRLHGYLLKKHWNGQALQGPDPGVRFNWRIGRFAKSYLGFLPWRDNLVYMQAQGYWILDNCLMAKLLDNEEHKAIALACSEHVLAAQRPEGYWEYPNPEWKDRIATVEGDFATLGLLACLKLTGDEPLLDGAKKWYRYLVEDIGFQGTGGLLSVNYFAHQAGDRVPNNSALTLRTLARLVDATNDDRYLAPYRGMIAWLKQVQLDTGELPYAIESTASPGRERHHFLCYQYNAFQFLDLADYYRTTGDDSVCPVLRKLSTFLSGAITASGAAKYDCGQETPEVAYYTMAVAAALNEATALGLGDFRLPAEKACRWVLSRQRADGGFEFFSRGNYGVLADRRSYPRYLAMILCHLLKIVETELPDQVSHPNGKEAAHPEER